MQTSAPPSALESERPRTLCDRARWRQSCSPRSYLPYNPQKRSKSTLPWPLFVRHTAPLRSMAEAQSTLACGHVGADGGRSNTALPAVRCKSLPHWLVSGRTRTRRRQRRGRRTPRPLRSVAPARGFDTQRPCVPPHVRCDARTNRVGRSGCSTFIVGRANRLTHGVVQWPRRPRWQRWRWWRQHAVWRSMAPTNGYSELKRRRGGSCTCSTKRGRSSKKIVR